MSVSLPQTQHLQHTIPPTRPKFFALQPPQNPENLLIFAAGNDGENQFEAVCTIGSPAIAKNVLAVGATSAGETRLNFDEIYDIDHVASLSSWGPTKDGRIKPEVVAPGDTVGTAAQALKLKLKAPALIRWPLSPTPPTG